MRRSEGRKASMGNKVWKNRESGFTLIEVIVAISLLMFGLLAVASMQVGAINGNAYANRVSEATTLVQDRIEQLMALPYGDVSSDSETVGAYSLETKISDGPTTNTKIITVEISGGGLKEKIAYRTVRANL